MINARSRTRTIVVFSASVSLKGVCVGYSNPIDAARSGDIPSLTQLLIQDGADLGAIAALYQSSPDMITKLLGALSGQQELRLDLVKETVLADCSQKTLLHLRDDLTLHEQRSLETRLAGTPEGRRLSLAGFGLDQGRMNACKLSDIKRIVAQSSARFHPEIEDCIEKHDLEPRISEVLAGRPGFFADEAQTVQQQLEMLTARQLSVLRCFIEAHLTPEARKQIVNKSVFRGKPTLENMISIFSGEAFGSRPPASYALRSRAYDALSISRLPEGSNIESWLDRVASSWGTLHAVTNSYSRGLEITLAFPASVLDAVDLAYKPEGSSKTRMNAMLAISDHIPEGVVGLAEWTDENGVLALRGLLDDFLVASENRAIAEVQVVDLDALSRGLKAYLKQPHEARCLIAQRGVSDLFSSESVIALTRKMNRSANALAEELESVSLPPRPLRQRSLETVVPPDQYPELYEYPEQPLFRCQGVEVEDLDNLLGQLSFEAPEDLPEEDRVVQTQKLLETGFEAMANNQETGETGYARFGKRVMISASLSKEHALIYPLEDLGPKLKIMATIRPKADPVFNIGRHAPESRLSDNECGIFGPPESDQVTWSLVETDEGPPPRPRFREILDPGRLKATIERLGNLIPEDYPFLERIGAIAAASELS